MFKKRAILVTYNEKAAQCSETTARLEEREGCEGGWVSPGHRLHPSPSQTIHLPGKSKDLAHNRPFLFSITNSLSNRR
jgi:hypothetical protein